MLRVRILIIAVIMSSVSTLQAQKATSKFVSKYADLAIALKEKWGIPVSIILGVSTLESGSGTSINCKQLNNYFGVTGKNHLKHRRTMYKQYASAEESFDDFCGIISRKKYYPKLKNNMSYQTWLAAMNHGNYAGAKDVWVSRVTNIIKKQGLYKYDK